MAGKGRIKIVYRDPSVASFAASDIVMNVTTGTLFYKRNRELYSFRGADSLAELVVFPGQSENNQILFNDTAGVTTATGVMQGDDQFIFKPASQTCGCMSLFDVGKEVLTNFSGSVRIGTHLPASCSILLPYKHEALYVRGNLNVEHNDSGSLWGNITSSGNISASGFSKAIVGGVTASQDNKHITSSGTDWSSPDFGGIYVGAQIYIATGAYGTSAASQSSHQLYTVTSIFSASAPHSASIDPVFDGDFAGQSYSAGYTFSGSIYNTLLEPSIYAHNAYFNEYIYHQKATNLNEHDSLGGVDSDTYIRFLDNQLILNAGMDEDVANKGSRIDINSDPNKKMFFYTSGSQRMTITNAGHVGIGTNSPSVLTHIYNADSPPITNEVIFQIGNSATAKLFTVDNEGDVSGSGTGSFGGGLISLDDVYIHGAEEHTPMQTSFDVLTIVSGKVHTTGSSALGGSGGSGTNVAIEDSNSQLTSAATVLDFHGAGVSLSAAGSNITLTIPGNPLTTQVDGGVTPVGSTSTTLYNFTGNGVTVSEPTTDQFTINIPGDTLWFDGVAAPYPFLSASTNVTLDGKLGVGAVSESTLGVNPYDVYISSSGTSSVLLKTDDPSGSALYRVARTSTAGLTADSWSFGISNRHQSNDFTYDNSYKYSGSFVIINDRKQPSLIIDKQTAGSAIHITSGSPNPTHPHINSTYKNHPTIGVASFVGINHNQPSESLHVRGRTILEGGGLNHLAAPGLPKSSSGTLHLTAGPANINMSNKGPSLTFGYYDSGFRSASEAFAGIHTVPDGDAHRMSVAFTTSNKFAGLSKPAPLTTAMWMQYDANIDIGGTDPQGALTIRRGKTSHINSQSNSDSSTAVTIHGSSGSRIDFYQDAAPVGYIGHHPGFHMGGKYMSKIYIGAGHGANFYQYGQGISIQTGSARGYLAGRSYNRVGIGVGPSHSIEERLHVSGNLNVQTGFISSSEFLYIEKSASFGAFKPLPYGNFAAITQNFNYISGSTNQITGSGTLYTSSLIAGQAIKIVGVQTSASLYGKITASNVTNYKNQISGAYDTTGTTNFEQLNAGDTIMIQQLSPYLQSYHTVVNVSSSWSMSISPNWEGTATSSYNEYRLPQPSPTTAQGGSFIYKCRPFEQWVTVMSFHNNTSMSISPIWSGSRSASLIYTDEPDMLIVRNSGDVDKWVVDLTGSTSQSGYLTTNAQSHSFDSHSHHVAMYDTSSGTYYYTASDALTVSSIGHWTLDPNELPSPYIYNNNAGSSGSVMIGAGPGYVLPVPNALYSSSLVVSGSVWITGSIGNPGDIQAVNNITSSGNISASGISHHLGNDVTLGDSCDDDINILGNITASCNFSGSSTSTLTIGGNATINDLYANHITASIISASSGFTGSLFGTSSWAQNIISASYALSSSHALTASFMADTFKQTGLRDGDSQITGSLVISGSGVTSLTVEGDVNINDPLGNVSAPLNIQTLNNHIATLSSTDDTGFVQISDNDTQLIITTKDDFFYLAGATSTYDQLAYDIDNERLGIGVSGPQTLLHISSGDDGDAILRIEADTDNNNENDNPKIEFAQDGGTLASAIGHGLGVGEVNPNNFYIANSIPYGGIGFAVRNTANYDAAETAMFITGSINRANSGSIGIGTQDPTEKAHISGSGGTFLLIDDASLATSSSAGIQLFASESVVSGRVKFTLQSIGKTITHTADAGEFQILDQVYGNSTTPFKIKASNVSNNTLVIGYRDEIAIGKDPTNFGSDGGVRLEIIDSLTGGPTGHISASGHIYASASYNENPEKVVVWVEGNDSHGRAGRFDWSTINNITDTSTFKATGHRDGDSVITGSLFISGSSSTGPGDITGSNMLWIRKSDGEGTPTFGAQDVAIFQNNDSLQDAAVTILASDSNQSRLHFGVHDDEDIGGIRYFHSDHAYAGQMRFRVGGNNVLFLSQSAGHGRLSIGNDASNNPSDYILIQGSLSGKGLTISSSNGAAIVMDRGDDNNNFIWEFKTDQDTKWTLGNITGENNDNFYIYNGDATSDKLITLSQLGEFAHIHTNVTASGTVSASSYLFADTTEGNYTDYVVHDSATGRFYTTSSAGISDQLNTFKATGHRAGDGVITGSLFVSSSNAGVGGNDVGGHITASYNISASGTGYFAKIGIGTSNPLEKLHVYGGTAVVKNITYGNNQNAPYLIAGTQNYTGATTNWGTYGMQHRIKSTAGGTPRLTIDDVNGELFSVVGGGYVGIGTNSPAPNKLQVVGSIAATSADGHITASGNISASGTGEFGYLIVSASTSDIHGVIDVRGAGANDSSSLRLRQGSNDAAGYDVLYNARDDHFEIKKAVAGGGGGYGNTPELSIQHSTGKIGINTQSPGERLTVHGNISASGYLFGDATTGNYTDYVVYNSSTGRLYITSSTHLIGTTPNTLANSLTQGAGIDTFTYNGSAGTNVGIDYTGTDNFIDVLSGGNDLEGTAIDPSDTIAYHDADDNNVKKGLISDLPFTNTAGTVTSVATAGTVNGITLTGGTITSTGTITLGGTLSNVANSQLQNSTISSIALGGNLANLTISTGLVETTAASAYNGSTARTITLDYTGDASNYITASPHGQLTSVASDDRIAIVDVSTSPGAPVKWAEISDLPFTNNTGDITSVKFTTEDGTDVTDSSGVADFDIEGDGTYLETTGNNTTDTITIGFKTGMHSISGINLGGNLNNLTVDNTTLQLSAGTTYNGSTGLTISAITGTVANSATSLTTGDQVYDFVTTQGYITGNQTITLSGDVTGTGTTSISTTIAANAVTNTKLADMAANTVKVRNANSSGDPSDLTVDNTEIIIGDGTGFTATSLSGDVTMTNAGVVSIGNNKITNAMMTNNSVDSAEIAANAVGPSELAATSVTAGSYTNTDLTVDAQGRITAASDGSGGGGTPAGSNGYIQFNTGGSFDAEQNLFWDKTNDRLGVNTNNPKVPLHVAGGNDATLVGQNTGYIVIGDTGGTNIVIDNNEIMARNNGTKSGLYIQNEGGLLKVHGSTGSTLTEFTILDSGDVGIGVDQAAITEKLQVGGNISGSGAHTATLSIGVDLAIMSENSSWMHVRKKSNLADYQGVAARKFHNSNPGTITSTNQIGIYAYDSANSSQIKKMANAEVDLNTFDTSNLPFTNNTGDMTGVNITGGSLISVSQANTTSGNYTATIGHTVGGVGAGLHGNTGNGQKIDTITVDAYGHVTAVAVGPTGNGDITGVTAGTGLDGGGVSGTVILNVDYSGTDNFIGAAAEATAVTNPPESTDHIVFEDLTGTDTVRHINFEHVPLSIFNNDSGFNNYTHPTNGVNASFTTGTGQVLGGITINNLGHTTAFSVRTLGMGDIDACIDFVGSTAVGSNGVSSGTADPSSGVMDFVAGPGMQVVMSSNNCQWTLGQSANSGNATQYYGNWDGGMVAEYIRMRGGTNNDVSIMTSNNEAVRVTIGRDMHVDGDIVAYSNTISDKRLKDNVVNIDGALSKILKLRGVEYDWNKGSRKGKHDLGVIAQEVEKIIPEIVYEKKMPLIMGDDDSTLYKTVDYEKLTAVLIEGMKEQQTQIEELRKEINLLKNK